MTRAGEWDFFMPATTGLATVRAAAMLMRAQLRARRLERDTKQVLTRPEPQLVIR